MSKVDGTVLDYQRSQKSRTYVGRRTITYITSIIIVVTWFIKEGEHRFVQTLL